MKKILLLLLSAAILATATGCSSADSLRDEPPVFPACWRADLAVDFNGFELTARFSQASPGCCTAEIVTPAEIAGMTLKTDSSLGDEASLNSLSFCSDSTTCFPDGSFVSIITQIMKIASADTAAFTAAENGWRLTEIQGEAPFTLTLSAEGIPLSLEAPDKKLSVVFSNFEGT